MAKVSKLIPCPNCGKKISENAAKCPHCGVKNRARKKSKLPKIILLLLVLAVVAGAVWMLLGGGKDDGTADTPEVDAVDQNKSEAKRS